MAFPGQTGPTETHELMASQASPRAFPFMSLQLVVNKLALHQGMLTFKQEEQNTPPMYVSST